VEEELNSIRDIYQAFLKNHFFRKPFYDLIHEHRARVIEHIDNGGASNVKFDFKQPPQKG